MSICDEDVHFARVLTDLRKHEDILFEAANEFCARCWANNAHILSYLQWLYALPEYVGETTLGRYCGPTCKQTVAPVTSMEIPEMLAPHIPLSTDSTLPSPPPSVEDLAHIEGSAVEKDEDEDDIDADEDGDGGIGMLIEHLVNIAVVM